MFNRHPGQILDGDRLEDEIKEKMNYLKNNKDLEKGDPP